MNDAPQPLPHLPRSPASPPSTDVSPHASSAQALCPTAFSASDVAPKKRVLTVMNPSTAIAAACIAATANNSNVFVLTPRPSLLKEPKMDDSKDPVRQAGRHYLQDAPHAHQYYQVNEGGTLQHLHPQVKGKAAVKRAKRARRRAACST